MKRIHYLVSVLLIISSIFFVFVQNDFSFLGKNAIDQAYAASLNDNFGVNGAIPSFGADEVKMDYAARRISDLHMRWTRHEFHYSSNMDFTFYDRARFYQNQNGVRTLGLLAYPGHGKTMTAWKNYVRSVVQHYSGTIYAWEIMNEADAYLSPSQYASYLREASTIIRSINPKAVIVSSGITSRPEAADFLDGLKAAGVWGKFDAVGLHVYHNGSPETVNWAVGSTANEISRIVGSINRNGGGKKIWITEMGYQSAGIGETKQGKYLARATIMARSFPAVDKIFFYRLYDNGNQSYGLLKSNLSIKSSYPIIRTMIYKMIGKRSGEKLLTSYNMLDDMDPVPSGWDAGETTNASLLLGGNWGYGGMALTMRYNFDMNADKAYTMSQKRMGDANAPVAIGAWIKGDNSKNFWKLRFEDSQGETFQLDFGSLSSDWQHVQFVFGRDPAITSWGGNGRVDYPIHFLNIVIDRMGGQASGEAWIDRIGFLPDIDTYAYKFGNLLVYWDQQGTGYHNLCGKKLYFTETPKYTSC